VNLGANFEITIKDLTELVARLCEFEGTIHWDTSRPNGQPRRRLATDRARRLFGFQAQVPFETGLKETIAWYLEHQAAEEKR
jgi:GDP-L-fucose synthase